MWSEPDSDTYTESISYIVDSVDSSGSPGELGPVRESARASVGERVVYSPAQDIVQRSASEQTLVSLCMWYSKQM